MRCHCRAPHKNSAIEQRRPELWAICSGLSVRFGGSACRVERVTGRGHVTAHPTPQSWRAEKDATVRALALRDCCGMRSRGCRRMYFLIRILGSLSRERSGPQCWRSTTTRVHLASTRLRPHEPPPARTRDAPRRGSRRHRGRARRRGAASRWPRGERPRRRPGPRRAPGPGPAHREQVEEEPWRAGRPRRMARASRPRAASETRGTRRAALSPHRPHGSPQKPRRRIRAAQPAAPNMRMGVGEEGGGRAPR